MKSRTRVNAGSLTANHNQNLRVKSSVKAGSLTANHSERFA